MATFYLREGQALERLRDIPDNSVDSIVTDAPYGMGKEPDPVKVMADWIKTGYHEITGKGFMGKEWDAFVPQPILWKECYRVLKPGGYLLSFFSTRTYDWGVMALRFAGFEIRDQISWLYGSGFPKSMDVSDAIDKKLGAIRPTEKLMVGDISNARYLKEGQPSPRVERDVSVKEPQTDEAKQWDGWGTALKPAHEPIAVCRKPLSEDTVAENILLHGTGGINLDACRIDSPDGVPLFTHRGEDAKNSLSDGLNGSNRTGDFDIETGRFPANIILDDFAAFLLDEQTGELTTGAQAPEVRKNRSGYSGPMPAETSFECEINSGGGSRFFYVAKPSKAERNAGLGRNFETRKTSDGREKENDTAFQRGKTERQNWHPTVKPIKLMQYLVRMVTPKGSLCLDPFNGSGTTGAACMLEGINYIGIDADPDCIPLSRARIQYWKNIQDGKLF